MGWLDNLINKTKKKTEEAVQGAIQQATPVVQNAVQNVTSGVQNAVQETVQQATPIVQNAAQNAVQTGQQAVQEAIQQGNEYLQGAVQTGQQMVQGAVQNASQAVTDKVNNINNQIHGNVPGTSTVPEQTPTNTPTNTPTQENSTFAVDEPILSYEDYLKKESEGVGYIKDETTQLLDKQSQETLQHIDDQLESDKAYAAGVKDTTETSLQKEKDEVYAYVNKMLGDTLAYNKEAYDTIVKNITDLMEQGKIQAGEAKELLMQIAKESKNATYGAAERQREEAERQADINRQRAIVDANSAYEQNKASYGAKAEALGNMGLTGGGYGDWLNASAYAQQRSEVQGARAQSDKAKADARYTEDMTKLQADQKYTEQKFQAESDYLGKVHELDTTYGTNLGKADEWKLAADKEARDAADATKRQADSDYNAGKLQSEITYGEMLHGYETQASEDKLEVKQDTEAKKLQAEISYVEGILGNSKALAEYKESLKAGDAAAEEKKLAVYEQLLAGVNNGTYDAETAAALADAFGFGDDWKKAISNAAGNKAEADAEIKAEQDQQQRVQNFDALLERGKTGALTADEITTMAAELGFDVNNPEDKKLIDLAVKAADNYKTASDEEKQYQKSSNALVILEGAKNGTYTAEEIPTIAAMLGLDAEKDAGIIKMLTDAASGYSNMTEDQQKTNAFINLLGSANNGELTSEELTYLAGKMGLGKEETTMLTKALERAASGDEAAINAAKAENFGVLLNGAKTGAYGADEVEAMAKMLGLKPAEGEKETEGYRPNDQALIDMLTGAANGYATDKESAITKSEEAQKTSDFINLLGSVSSGEFTRGEAMQIAQMLGLKPAEGEKGTDGYKSNDQGLLDLIGAAADRYARGTEEDLAQQKTMNFISLLDGANTGAYGADQVEQMAKMLGLDPEKDKNLIDMLKTAADDYANGEAGKTAKEDMQYQNAIYSELLAAANNGDYTEAQIKDLAKRFGIEDPDNILGEAARTAKEGSEKEAEDLVKGDSAKNALEIKGMINGATTDEYIDDYVDAGYITEEDAAKLKEDRNNMAKTEVEDLVKSGDYDGAIDRAEELKKLGYIDDDTYQSAYFGASLNNCQQVKTVADIKAVEADLTNLRNAGKISQRDYDNLVSYMYQNVIQVLPKENADVKYSNSDLEITIDGIPYKISKYKAGKKPATSDIKNMLDKYTLKGEKIAMYDGVLYLKTSTGEWFASDNKNMASVYGALYDYQPKATAPKHQSEYTSQDIKDMTGVGSIGPSI